MATTGEYLVGTTIGEGAFSQVLHARHKVSERDVAIKVIAKVTLNKNPYILKRILREQNLLQQLKDSEYVVNLWASFHDSQCCYFVMECTTGGDLKQVMREAMKNKSSSENSSASLSAWYKSIPHYGRQIVEAVHHIHSRNIIHCDLKPDNILCKTNGQIQLGDFGCAVELNTPHRSEKCEECRPKHTGKAANLLGTADYACPELLRGTAEGDLTVAVDMWSLGCIFYALWFGQSPFHAPSDSLAIEKIIKYVNNRATNDASELLFYDKDGSHLKHEHDCQSNIEKFDLCLSKEWKVLIGLLLEDCPTARLGSTQESLLSLLDNSVWDGLDLSKKPPFVPPEAPWVSRSVNNAMRDGKQGWAAFML